MKPSFPRPPLVPRAPSTRELLCGELPRDPRKLWSPCHLDSSGHRDGSWTASQHVTLGWPQPIPVVRPVASG